MYFFRFYSTSNNLLKDLQLTIFIDGFLFTCISGCTILQACLRSGIEIPRFCYHDKLSIAGNCRMCLVESSNSKKLVASCAVPVQNVLEIFTSTLRVKKAREAVLEFLLINHPLDCPICDQGGECDLQDITMTFGSDRSRFYELQKRAVEDKYCGPLVKTVMTRCIHCTRCIRFLNEVCGTSSFGMIGRGSQAEVGTYISTALSDELSANIIDLCPVGALTSKPYAFTSRPWELKSLESIDILDSLGSNIKLEVYGNKVMRILPRINDFLNEDWLTNKARFIYDAFSVQRLTRPMFKVFFLLNIFKDSFSFNLLDFEVDCFVPVSWRNVLNILIELTSSFPSRYDFGDFLDFESIFLYKTYAMSTGAFFFDSSLNNAAFDLRSLYFSCFLIKDLENFKFFVSMGTNLRLESPLLNSRVRKSYNTNLNFFKFYILGLGLNYFTYPIRNFANSSISAIFLTAGKSPLLKYLIKFNKSVVMFLSNALELTVLLILGLILNIFLIWQFAAHLNLLELGIPSSKRFKWAANCHINYFIGQDNFVLLEESINIYQGHHGDIGASKAHFILPTCTYIEKFSSYYNLEGLVQFTKRAVSGLTQIREDWKIALALLNLKLYYSDIELFSRYIPVVRYKRDFSFIWTLLKFQLFSNFCKFTNHISMKLSLPKLGYIKNYLFSSLIENYYRTDVFSRASKIMGACSLALLKRNYTF